MALSLTDQIKKVFEEYDRDTKRKVNNAVDTVAKDAVATLKNTSPKRTGSYARGWKISRERGRSGINDVIIHNATDYRLTHLLENGHVIRNKKGTYGRTNGIKHIAPVEEKFNSDIVNEIEKELQ